MHTSVICFAVVLLINFCHLVQSHVINNRPKIVIDHDGGADDAMAIFIALLREKYFGGPELVALSTVHGNVNESQAFENTQRILDVAERQEVPIYRGSTEALVIDAPQDHFFGNDGLGDNENIHYWAAAERPQHSVMALLELSKIYEGDLIVVALAPLTNIALALKLDPQFINRLKHLYIGGGNVYSSSFPKPEFNTMLDVEAYYIAMKQATASKVTVVPFSEMIRTLPISAEWRLNTLGAIETRIMKAQNQFEAVSLVKSATWDFLDPIVLSIMEDNNVIARQVFSRNNVTLSGPDRGIVSNDFKNEEPNIVLVTAGAEDYYKQFLLDTFTAELKQFYYVNKIRPLRYS